MARYHPPQRSLGLGEGRLGQIPVRPGAHGGYRSLHLSTTTIRRAVAADPHLLLSGSPSRALARLGLPCSHGRPVDAGRLRRTNRSCATGQGSSPARGRARRRPSLATATRPSQPTSEGRPGRCARHVPRSARSLVVCGEGWPRSGSWHRSSASPLSTMRRSRGLRGLPAAGLPPPRVDGARGWADGARCPVAHLLRSHSVWPVYPLGGRYLRVLSLIAPGPKPRYLQEAD